MERATNDERGVGVVVLGVVLSVSVRMTICSPLSLLFSKSPSSVVGSPPPPSFLDSLFSLGLVK